MSGAMEHPTPTFTLGQVLSITHEVLMCPVPDLYAILNHMTGQSLYTHQLPKAGRAAMPVLRAHLPAIAAVDLGHVNKHNWQAELAKLEAVHGNRFEVPVLTDWSYEDPTRVPVRMFGKDNVIVLETGTTEGHADA